MDKSFQNVFALFIWDVCAVRKYIEDRCFVVLKCKIC